MLPKLQPDYSYRILSAESNVPSSERLPTDLRAIFERFQKVRTEKYRDARDESISTTTALRPGIFIAEFTDKYATSNSAITRIFFDRSENGLKLYLSKKFPGVELVPVDIQEILPNATPFSRPPHPRTIYQEKQAEREAKDPIAEIKYPESYYLPKLLLRRIKQTNAVMDKLLEENKDINLFNPSPESDTLFKKQETKVRSIFAKLPSTPENEEAYVNSIDDLFAIKPDILTLEQMAEIEDIKNTLYHINTSDLSERERIIISDFYTLARETNKAWAASAKASNQTPSTSSAPKPAEHKLALPGGLAPLDAFVYAVKLDVNEAAMQSDQYPNFLRRVYDLLLTPNLLFKAHHSDDPRDTGLTTYIIALKYCRQLPVLERIYDTIRHSGYGASIFEMHVKDHPHYARWSPLMMAAVYNEPKVVEHLLSQSVSLRGEPPSYHRFNKLTNHSLLNRQTRQKITALSLLSELKPSSSADAQRITENAKLIIRHGAIITNQMVQAALSHNPPLYAYLRQALINQVQTPSSSTNISSEEESEHIDKKRRL